MLHSEVARQAGLGVSLFERLFVMPGIPHVVLNEQYRMHPTIAEWPSIMFYAGAVHSHWKNERREPIPGFPWRDGSAVAFVHVQGLEEADGNSYCNNLEAEVVRKVLEPIL